MRFSKISEGNWEETIQVLNLIMDIKLLKLLIILLYIKMYNGKAWDLNARIWILNFEIIYVHYVRIFSSVYRERTYKWGFSQS